MRPSDAYSVVVLPEPVGPVTSTMPCGWRTSRSKDLSTSPLMPRPSSVNFDSLLSSSRSTARSPCALASVDTRTSMARPPTRKRDAAVLRQALFGDVELGHDLQPADQRRMQRAVGLHHLAQAAVDAEAHRAAALVGLDVDVAGAVLHRLRQQRVEHADDRRVVAGFEQVFHRRQVLHQRGSGRPRFRPRRPRWRRWIRRRHRPRRCG